MQMYVCSHASIRTSVRVRVRRTRAPCACAGRTSGLPVCMHTCTHSVSVKRRTISGFCCSWKLNRKVCIHVHASHGDLMHAHACMHACIRRRCRCAKCVYVYAYFICMCACKPNIVCVSAQDPYAPPSLPPSLPSFCFPSSAFWNVGSSPVGV